MPRGASDIPDLRLSRINKLIQKFMTPPSMLFSNLFGTDNADSDTIKWESQIGNRGVTPMKAPGSPSQVTAPVGVSQNEAVAAFWGEKEYHDEEFLNNLREEGTASTYLSAKRRIAREFRSMRNRCDRRLELLFAQMLINGEITYSDKGGVKLSIDYAIPSENQVTLGANYYWTNGTQRNIVGDIMDAKIVVSDSCTGIIDHMVINSNTLKVMAMDSSIQTLLSKSNFGNGDLFGKSAGGIIGVRPRVLGELLGIPNIVVYDEKYVIEQTLTAAVAAGGTTVYVGNAADFTTGTAVLHDISAGTSESVTVSAVSTEAGTLTIGATTAAFRAGEDKITQTLPFMPNNKTLLMASTVEGSKIAEFIQAPYGLNRAYGLFADTKENWDPDGIWLRVQNKGLPVLYHRDAIYSLTFAA